MQPSIPNSSLCSPKAKILSPSFNTEPAIPSTLNASFATRTLLSGNLFSEPVVNPITTLTSPKHWADTTPPGSIVVNNTSLSWERTRNLSDNLHSPNPISIRSPIDYGQICRTPDQVAIEFILFPIYRRRSLLLMHPTQ
ncbi:uncharacterized protein CEXT_254191 [Caerostris extrusa]|uniref:Uncharacterized protein n=1 Tax=Caerostris extrusa TaxID=172846 RepID=A0AAV4X1V7_CAEEX|nr:uncharacterized protein CEXT_254191 [Caerostris extrusa]